MSAEVLPKGVYRIGFDAAYKRSTEYFTNSWGTNTESIVDDYNDIVVEPSLLLDLSGIGLSDEFMNWFNHDFRLGTTNFELDSWAIKYQFSLFYGITDRLSVGLVIPFTKGEYTIGLALDDCNAALNPNYDPTSVYPILDQLPILPIETTLTDNPALNKLIERFMGQVERYMPVREPLDFDDINTFFTDPRFGFEYNELPTPGSHVETGINDSLIALR
ncbi:hypothetical protein ACFL4G_13440, partial [Thermodesulfobacteriota bacterium]